MKSEMSPLSLAVPERVGFPLPLGSARPMYIRMLIGTIIGLAFPYLQEIARLFGMTIPLYMSHQLHYSTFLAIGYLLIVILVIAAACYHAHRNWIFLSKDGIEGACHRGAKVLISWSEPINIKNGSDMGIKCLVISSEKSDRKILLPMSIARSMEFKSVLNRAAPSNHRLHRFIVDTHR